MTEEEAYKRLNEVFRDVFDDEAIAITGKTTAEDIEDWDSLTHINLIVAIEKEFNIKFSMGETQKMKNIGEMVNIILKRTSENS